MNVTCPKHSNKDFTSCVALSFTSLELMQVMLSAMAIAVFGMALKTIDFLPMIDSISSKLMPVTTEMRIVFEVIDPVISVNTSLT